MLDINQLRHDLPGVIARLEKRKSPQPFLDVARFQALEAERKTIQTRTEELQARRNSLSKQIGQAKSKGQDASALMAEVGGIGDELKASAERLEHIQSELQALLMAVPNLPHDSAPVGPDENANVEVRRWGTPRAFDFTPKDHVDLGGPLGLDFDIGAKLSGSRFTFLRGPVARLHRALAQFMLDTQTQAHGYTECYTPYIVNREILEGTGQLPKLRRRGRRSGRRGQRAVPDFHVGDLAHQHGSRAGAGGERAADQAHRAQPLLSQRSGQRRPRHARHDPPAPVRQGRDGADRAPGSQLCSARGDDRPRRGHPAEAGLALPGRRAVHRRPELRLDQDL